jgi:hypothetical protein
MSILLTEAGIKIKLQDIESKIKQKNNFSREDVQTALNAIRGYGFSVDRKKEILKDMIARAGIKIIGLKTLYTPRQGLTETDKTLDFLSDIYSYHGVIEREY